jgi:hypothetical protein
VRDVCPRMASSRRISFITLVEITDDDL